MVIFARMLLQEKITVKKGLSVCLATIGVLLIVGVGGVGDSFQLGGLILGLAALTWALMSVLVKKVPESYSQLVITTYAIGIATLAMTPLAIPQLSLGQFHQVLAEPLLWGGILYVGIVSTAGAFFFWNKGLQLVDASRAGLYFFFQPVVGTLLGWLFLGEQVGPKLLAGSLADCRRGFCSL